MSGKPQPSPSGSSPAKGDADIDALRAATDGLFYPSESDAPFKPFRWSAVAGRSAESEVKGREGDNEIEKVAPDVFFKALEATSDGPRFHALRLKLDAMVKDLTIYRVGTINVKIYLIGKARDGSWLGLQTASVET